MSKAIENLQTAQARAMRIRPAIGGFPYLAEVLRRAGVTRNEWILPSCQSTYDTQLGTLVMAATPLIQGIAEVPTFDRDSLVRALREDQSGGTTFPQFLNAAWRAGVVRYEVDFQARRVVYFGSLGERYAEDYLPVDLPDDHG